MENQMNLHENKNDYHALIDRTSEYLNIPSFFIEKDYWVTFALKNLSVSKFSDQVVFKGGTSLSKAYNCIERFSEDIDLALKDPELGDAKRKALMKKIEAVVTQGFTPLDDHPEKSKFGRNRKTFYEYPRLHSGNKVSPVKDVIQLEINTFTHPSPVEVKSIETFIRRFLEDKGFISEISQYDLHKFNVQTLSIERTLCEKILSLVRLSYEGVDHLRSKVRHFYDITCILEILKLSDTFRETLSLSMADDKNNPTFSGIWLKNPLYQAPLFEDFNTIWKSLEHSYVREMSNLAWSGKIPLSKEVSHAFDEIGSFIQSK